MHKNGRKIIENSFVASQWCKEATEKEMKKYEASKQKPEYKILGFTSHLLNSTQVLSSGNVIRVCIVHFTCVKGNTLHNKSSFDCCHASQERHTCTPQYCEKQHLRCFQNLFQQTKMLPVIFWRFESGVFWLLSTRCWKWGMQLGIAN